MRALAILRLFSKINKAFFRRKCEQDNMENKTYIKEIHKSEYILAYICNLCYHIYMRTTIEFNNYTFKQVKELQARTGRTLSLTVNELVEKALRQPKNGSYVDFRVKAKNLGTLPGVDYSNTHALLEMAEGESYK